MVVREVVRFIVLLNNGISFIFNSIRYFSMNCVFAWILIMYKGWFGQELV